MSELPEQWRLAPVGELIDLGPKNDCPDDTEVGFVPLARLGVTYRSRHTFEPKAWSEVKKGYTHFADGDVLLARITPSFENGKAGIARGLPSGLGAGSTEYFVCRPVPDGLLPEYLLAHFKMPQFLRDGEQVMSGAVGQQRVPKQYVLESLIPLAPFNEQRRIVDKLDTVFARVDACREHLDRVPAILKRFRQAVLAAATSGKLTEDWREEDNDEQSGMHHLAASNDSSLPIGWHWSSADEIKADDRHALAIGPFGSNLKVSDYTSEGTPLVFVRDIRARVFGGPGTKYISVTKAQELSAHSIRGGDLLITKMGDPPGDTAIYPIDAPDAVITADCIKLRVNEEIANPRFVGYVIESAETRERIQEITAGVAQQKVSLKRFRGFPLQLAPLAEQHEIVSRVESLLAYADRLEARYSAASAQIEHLPPALLAKAFRGELVPQDPNDEPASALLERIRAARVVAEETGAKRRQRKRPAKSKTKSKTEVIMLTRKDIQPSHLSTILKTRGPLTAEDLWSSSQLEIDDFYDQLKDEEVHGLLKETRAEDPNTPRLLEAA